MKHTAWLVGLYCWVAVAIAQNNPSANFSFVKDEPAWLSRIERDSLEQKLKNYRDTTSNVLVVYLVNTLGNKSIEEYSADVFLERKFGQKGKENGVLIVVAAQERKMRISVGTGLEGRLTDIQTKRLQDEILRPALREKRYYEGLNTLIDRLIDLAKGEFKPSNTDAPPASVGSPKVDTSTEDWYWTLLAFTVLGGIGGLGIYTDNRKKARTKAEKAQRLYHSILDLNESIDWQLWSRFFTQESIEERKAYIKEILLTYNPPKAEYLPKLEAVKSSLEQFVSMQKYGDKIPLYVPLADEVYHGLNVRPILKLWRIESFINEKGILDSPDHNVEKRDTAKKFLDDELAYFRGLDNEAIETEANADRLKATLSHLEQIYHQPYKMLGFSQDFAERVRAEIDEFMQSVKWDNYVKMEGYTQESVSAAQKKFKDKYNEICHNTDHSSAEYLTAILSFRDGYVREIANNPSAFLTKPSQSSSYYSSGSYADSSTTIIGTSSYSDYSDRSSYSDYSDRSSYSDYSDSYSDSSSGGGDYSGGGSSSDW